MSYFIYNGICSQNFGILERCPIPPQAEEKYEEVSIPGRTETLLHRKKTRPDGTLSFVLGMKDLKKLRSCYAWLTGTGDLILSSCVTEKYRVKKIKTSPEYVSRRFGKINITMTISPFAYSVEDKPIDVTGNIVDAAIINNGLEIAQPIITFLLKKDENAVLKGDVDLDGFVTAMDAANVLVATTTNDFSGWTDKQLKAADMNDDGEIDAIDASMILQKAADTRAFNDAGTAYDVYISLNGNVMRISVPEECSIRQFPVTVDCENEIVYYLDENGKKVNILDRTYGDLPHLEPGKNMMHYISNIPMQYMRIKKNERW